MRKLRWLSMSVFVSALMLRGAAAEETVNIDFEGFAELTPISTQFSQSHGVTFSILNNPTAFPIIAVDGCPIRAYDGGSQCTQHDTPSVSNGGVAALTDPLVGGTPAPNYSVGQSIVMTFNPPIDAISLFILDIDNDDSMTVRAMSNSTVVMEVTKTAADPDTGNRFPTPFSLSGSNITRVEVLVDPVTGYAIDDISLTRGSCPAGDVNGDCKVDVNDVHAFVAVLLGQDSDGGHVSAADADNSGSVNGNDIQPFIEELLGD